MSERDLTIKDRLEDILESIGLIEEWSQGMTELHDFMISPGRVMAFNAMVTHDSEVPDFVSRKSYNFAHMQRYKVYLKVPNNIEKKW